MTSSHLFPGLDAFAVNEGLLLYPGLVPRPLNYIERIMADGKITPGELITELFPGDQPEPHEPVGALEVTPGGLLERIYSGASQAHVMWDKPLIVTAACWPYDDAPVTELSLSIRQKGAPISTPWMRVRTVWPSDALYTEPLAVQQVHALYLKPRDFARLWHLLNEALGLYRGSLRSPFTREVDDATLDALKSERIGMYCIGCGSKTVGVLAPDAYHCYVCGYEGGSGYAQYKANLHRQAFAALPRDERLAMALDDLGEALDHMRAANHYRWTVRTDEDVATYEDDLIEVGHAHKFCGLAFQRIELASFKATELQDVFDRLLALRDDCIPKGLGARVVSEIEGVIRRVERERAG